MSLANANSALRSGELTKALPLYLDALRNTPGLSKTITANIALARKKYRAQRQGQKPLVLVCLPEKMIDAATLKVLSQAYQAFGVVECVAGTQSGDWTELPGIPVHRVAADGFEQFVGEHPCDVVHLLGQDQDCLAFAALSKLIWGAAVIGQGNVGMGCVDAVVDKGIDGGKLEGIVREALGRPFAIGQGLLNAITGSAVGLETYALLTGDEKAKPAPRLSPQITDKKITEKYSSVTATSPITRHPSHITLPLTPLERIQANSTPPAVIVPVYNAAQELELCLSSLVIHTPPDVRVIVINDASTDPQVQKILDRYSRQSSFTIQQNPENVGYTNTVNKGLEIAGTADVILLNSDTQVTPFWVRNLRLAAYSEDNIGTATPFSNNAGSFSVPEPDQDNPLPSGMSLDDYARAVTRSSQRTYPRVPTGNGFCMYIRRDCLNDVGLFDAQAFPRGYGEENDFCMRAGQKGWKHVIDDATLIYHERSASFGNEKTALIDVARQVIADRYPSYESEVRAAFSGKALISARERVRSIHTAKASRVKKRVLYVLSPPTGGTPLTNQDLMSALAGYAETLVLHCDATTLTLTSYEQGRHVELEQYRLSEPLQPFPHRAEEYDRIVSQWLLRYGIELVHVRHIALHGLGLIDVAKNLGLPIVFSLHDFYTVCPSIKLVDEQNTFCKGQCTPGPGPCQHELWQCEAIPNLKHTAIQDWQRQMEVALKQCDALITTSPYCKSLVSKTYPSLIHKAFPIIPHGRDFSTFYSLACPFKPGEPIKILVPGHISVRKGSKIIAELSRLGQDIGLEIHVLGYIEDVAASDTSVVLHGEYERERFSEKVRDIRPHLGGVFSIWPETHSHTLTELWSCGIPVIGFDFGAIGERLRETGAGWLVEKPSALAVLEVIKQLLDDPAQWQSTVNKVTAWQRGTGKEWTCGRMAQEYVRVYETLSPGWESKGVPLPFMVGGLPASSRYSTQFNLTPFSKRLHTIGTAVSVIILTHNSAHHLDTCLTTFFQKNTHKPVELIIIDHASTDYTAQIVAKHKSKGDINYIRRDKNYTFSESCNFAATKAKHPYLLFLNDDIIYTDDVLGKALEMLGKDEKIGAVGVRLDDVPAEGKEQGIQHLGVEFKWNEKRGYHQPEQIRHPNVKQYLSDPSRLPLAPYPPAVTGAFLLCRKSDFDALKGFSEEYNYGLEDIDFCLRLGRDLKKKCWCMNEVGLQHVEGATRKEWYKSKKSEIIENNHKIFKKKWAEFVRDNFIQALQAKSAPQQSPITRQEDNASEAPRILFVLPQTAEGNNGYQVQLLSRMLQAQGATCTIAVPDSSPITNIDSQIPILPYSKISNKNSLDYNVIRAWTPREIVREFTEKLLAKHNCPLIIHLEDNEEYLTEVTLGKAYADLSKMSEAELDKIIPKNRFHPIRGRKFLSKAQGLTMVIETLNRYNPNGLPYQVIPPIVDERLFYPRPLNKELRKKHNIPDDTTVLVYTGNVHAGNKDEVFELYKAVDLLNQQGRPTKLLRTGQDNKTLDTSSWPRKHEIHLGWVKREELPEIMAAADIFVQPGKPGPFNDERIPCKLPEYFAMGRPVVLPRTNVGLKVEHGVEGYVLEKVDAEGIAGAVQEICKQPNTQGNLAVGSMVFYRNELYSNYTDTLTNVYPSYKRAA